MVHGTEEVKHFLKKNYGRLQLEKLRVISTNFYINQKVCADFSVSKEHLEH